MKELLITAILSLSMVTPALAHNHHHTIAHKRSRDRVLAKGHYRTREAEKPTDEAPNGRPRRITGTIEIDGHGFPFTSGGRGWSIPWGDYEITTDPGPWGSRHGALALNHDDDLPDPVLNRVREGVEIHRAPGDTAGCIGIHGGFDALKGLVLNMINTAGHAWLHVWPFGTGISEVQEWSGPEPVKVTAKRDPEDDDTLRHHHYEAHRHHHYRYAIHHRHLRHYA